MDDGSASLFCFTPLRVTISELDRLRTALPSPESSLGPDCSVPAIPQGPCPVSPSDSSTALAALVEDWCRQVSQLHAKVDRLEREVVQLEGENRQLQADLFGRRSEARPGKDRSNDLDDPQEDSQKPRRN